MHNILHLLRLPNNFAVDMNCVGRQDHWMKPVESLSIRTNLQKFQTFLVHWIRIAEHVRNYVFCKLNNFPNKNKVCYLYIYI